jgi:outer membrane protein OmpA-like peptidoglycan-associated protein
MKIHVSVLVLLLMGWIAGSTYWYVCKIRHHCGAVPIEAIDLSQQNDSLPAVERPDSMEVLKLYFDTYGNQKVYFEFASGITNMEVIPAEYYKHLKQYTDINAEVVVTVVGHADNRGTPKGNEKFSRLRADFVKAKLVQSGIHTDQITTISKSDTEPAAPNSTAEGRTQNRRAEIIIKIN